MSVLVDTNLLLRSLQPQNPHFPAASTAILSLNLRKERLCVVPQVLYEFWAVCTRPTFENGLGMTTVQAGSEQTKVLSLFTLLPDTAAIFAEWQRIVVQHDVKGKNAHDARVVAAMAAHGLTRILTFNLADFARYPGITVLDPSSFVSPPQAPRLALRRRCSRASSAVARRPPVLASIAGLERPRTRATAAVERSPLRAPAAGRCTKRARRNVRPGRRFGAATTTLNTPIPWVVL